MIQGCPIEFESMPKQLSKAHPISHNPDERKIINIELDKLLSKGVIEETTHLEGEFLSSILVRKKKDDSYRMILNLKDLNYSIEKKHFKMDTFLSAVNLVKQNCYMASVDLRDAYYTIAISAEFRKYLRFEWQGKLYQYTCLPNRLSSAPRYFTKILKPVYSLIRSKGHLNVGYIDDSYLQGDTFEECKHNVRDSVSLFAKLGFLPHPEKSVFEPTQKIIFLGFVINSVIMTISTPEKALKICTACKKLSAKSECSNQIQTLWVTSEIDLFATRANRQLAMFALWKPDPEATYIDAFTFYWSQHKFYCFPPFSLISRCLRKVEVDQAEGILIAPIWPTQVWWPQMLRLLIKHPVALPQQKSLLKLPNKKVHPLHAKMVLMACYISGNPMKQEEFWSQLATSS